MTLDELAEREPMHPALAEAIRRSAFSDKRYPAKLRALSHKEQSE